MSQKQEIFTLMGGRVKMRRGTYNPTSDAVWLAAFGAGRGARTVLDVGVGTGGAVLCLGAHDGDAVLTGLDVSEKMLAECAQNAALNRREIELICNDINTWRTARTFDMVITNPPYFNGTPAIHNAHHNADLPIWVRKCVARVRPRGTFCIIVDAAAMAPVLAEMARKCGDIEVMPLFSTKNTAERVLISGRVGTRGGVRLYRGMCMNDDAVLRDGLTIDDALSRLGAL